jgi:nicotinate phosphoribosyltransferase
MFGVPVKGTHAHSWVMSFPDEYTAFKTYAKMYPDACLLLVDTYDTLKQGVPNAIRVFQEMKEEGIESKMYGIRLDSGDLAYLSKKARIMLDEAGFPDAIISASSDLDEYLIDSLMTQDAKITSWGVGTNLITSADCPAFGGVYKLAAVKQEGEKEFTAKIKISENPQKITNPGNKTVYRIYDRETGKIRADLICLVGEKYDESEALKIFAPDATWKKLTIEAGTYRLRELLVPIFVNGRCVYNSPATMEIKKFCEEELATLWDETRRLVNPQEVYVDLSKPLYELKQELLNKREDA